MEKFNKKANSKKINFIVYLKKLKEIDLKKIVKVLSIISILIIICFVIIYYKYTDLKTNSITNKEVQANIKTFNDLSVRINKLKLKHKAKKLGINEFYKKNKQIIENIYVVVQNKHKYYLNRNKDFLVKRGEQLIAVSTKKETVYLYKKKYILKEKK